MKIALIDADSILYRAGWNKDFKVYSDDKELLEKSADTIISSIFLETKATHYIGFFSIGDSFRKQEFKSYKSNRDNLVRPNHLEYLRNYITDKWNFIQLKYYEADDGVSICNKIINDSFICSPDKDVLKLPGYHYNYNKTEWVNTTQEEASLFFWRSMIIGDTADGIKGLEGKGKVFAEKYINEYCKLSFCTEVFDLYVSTLGEYRGIEEFNKNYKLLKILSRDSIFERRYEHYINNPEKVKTNMLVI